jgi:hypothetical protein
MEVLMAREPDTDTIHCTLRLPDEDLEERIRKLADKYGRSLNAQLVHLLKAGLRLEEAGFTIIRSS